MRTGSRLYRWLMLAFPSADRVSHGDEMLRLFQSEQQARAGRPFALATLWVRAIADVLWHGLAERWGRATSVTDFGRDTRS